MLHFRNKAALPAIYETYRRQKPPAPIRSFFVHIETSRQILWVTRLVDDSSF
jgi:hypothetical protein